MGVVANGFWFASMESLEMLISFLVWKMRFTFTHEVLKSAVGVSTAKILDVRDWVRISSCYKMLKSRVCAWLAIC